LKRQVAAYCTAVNVPKFKEKGKKEKGKKGKGEKDAGELKIGHTIGDVWAKGWSIVSAIALCSFW